MATFTVPELVEAIVVRPGDRLLIRVDRNTDPDQIIVMGERLRERFPDVEVTVITADQLTVSRND